MHRMGHASPQAALRYQHATRERDTEIAKSLGELVEAATDADERQRPRDGRGMELVSSDFDDDQRSKKAR
jgi:hypothetical protein